MDDIIMRLNGLGYMEISDIDRMMIPFLVEKVGINIKNYCHIDTVPDQLRCVVVERVCGEFLNSKKAGGAVPGFDLEKAVKSIAEGDTTVTFAIGDGTKTPEQRLEALIASLVGYGHNELSAFRCLKW